MSSETSHVTPWFFFQTIWAVHHQTCAKEFSIACQGRTIDTLAQTFVSHPRLLLMELPVLFHPKQSERESECVDDAARR
jgi:hypothetical protein